MMFSRLVRLKALLACLVCFTIWIPLVAQQQQTQPPAQKKQNPFEAVPQSPVPEAPKPAVAKPSGPQTPGAKPTFEAPKPAAEPPVGAVADFIEAIEFRGARRVPQDTLRSLVDSKKGDKVDDEALHRDFMKLWNSLRFDDITLEKEPGRTGWIVRFVVTERRVVRSIKYDGAKSVTVSEILDRFKERKVGLTVESQYDPNKVQRAAVVLKELLSERGRQFAKIDPQVRQIPPSSLEVNFVVDEGPKVKVGQIEITGNEIFNQRAVIRAMKNLRPIGIPNSILLENLFAKSFDANKLEQDKDMIRNWLMISCSSVAWCSFIEF